MAFFNKLNPFSAPGLRTLGKAAPIKKLGMSPKPAAPGIGPSGGGMAAQNAAQKGMGTGAGQGQMHRPMMNGPMMRPQMGGMQQQLKQAMEGGMRPPGWGRGGGPQYNGNPSSPDFSGGIMGPRAPQGGQLQGTPIGEAAPPQEGVMPEPLPQGQAMQQQPGMGPSPDMMNGLMGRMGGNRGYSGGLQGGWHNPGARGIGQGGGGQMMVEPQMGRYQDPRRAIFG